jgi:UDP-N-acetylglucosamine:LPS N-acetylglucosamine transferase
MSTKESKIRDVIREYEADVVISVHPLMNDIPVQSCMKISNETNRHLPFFTVVTDLGSGHCAWFDKSVEKMFIASNAIEKLAKERGNVPDDKLVMSGLPIRYEFAFEAERLGDRTSMEGKIYQLQMRGYLNLLDGNCSDSDDIGDTHSNNHYNNSTDSSTNRMNINKNDYCCNSNNSHDHDRKVLLVMGGGEGVGSLSNIVNKLYVQCSLSNIRAMILVVCGRNETLKESLETRDWDSFLEDEIEALRYQQEQKQSKGKIISQTQYQEGKQQQQQQENLNSKLPKQQQQQSSDNQSIARKVTGIVINPLRVLSQSTLSKILPKEKNHHKTDDNIKPIIIEEEKKECCEIPTASSRSSSLSSTTSTKSSLPPPPSQIIIKPLGFVTNMAEYMVAADILVTKAGPGTIAEAASLGLPVLLTSFLPGQEEGNVDFVVEKKFGEYQSDSNPEKVAHTACQWLRSPDKMNEMSMHAKKAGMPNAAEDIVKCIGKSVLRWKELHEDVISGGEDI